MQRNLKAEGEATEMCFCRFAADANRGGVKVSIPVEWGQMQSGVCRFENKVKLHAF